MLWRPVLIYYCEVWEYFCPITLLTNVIYVCFFADQTPTPTRFLKNCEEVGLFNELASSFEHEFTKAHEDEQRTKHPVRKMYTVNEWRTVGFLGSSDKSYNYFWLSERLYSSSPLCSKAAPLQTPSEVKDEDEGPLQVDSSSPGSPDSSSSMSDDSRDSRVRGKVQRIATNCAGARFMD